uniref:Uncharacterized protein LOC111114603 isoform X3 n=1 Tax=Crassostrea virginica TaxID=6565 RepID=A0A8B8BZ73_CRAVI|nr:uncharacterized protein LOC111114603 isoform X3 [Crassostrea virginica]
MSDFDLIQSGTHKRKSRSGERLEEVFRLHGEQSSPAVKKAEQKPTLLQNYQYLCVAVLAIGISSILILTTVCLIGKRMHHDEVKLNTVHKCPQNKAEWKDREREFKCPEINKAHVYHCVLDSKGTKLLEVCAPVVNIQGGRCTAFDISRHTIQESSISCSDTCPNEYKSSDAYLYQSCYEQVYETEHRNTKFSLINHHYGLRSLGTVNMILVGLLLLLLIIIILQKIMSFYCKMDDNKDEIKASENKAKDDSQSLKDAFDILLLKIKDDVSTLTFGKELLAAAHFDEFLSKVQFISTSGDLLFDIPHNTESVEPGAIFVFNVEVLFEDNKLVVKEMDNCHGTTFFDPELTNTTRVIWIESTSLHTIDAKLEVYKDYENYLTSTEILLHHKFEDSNEIYKRSALQRLNFLSNVVIAIKDVVSSDYLLTVLHNVTEQEFSLEKLKAICNKINLKDVYESLSYSLEMQSLETLLNPFLREVAKSYETKLLEDISTYTEHEFETNLKKTFADVKLHTSADAFQELVNDVNDVISQFLLDSVLSVKEDHPFVYSQRDHLNAKVWRDQVAIFLHEIVYTKKTAIITEIFKRINGVCNEAQDGMRRISTLIDDFISQIAISDQQTMRSEWKMRKAIVDALPSNLTFVAGRKNNISVVKVYLKDDNINVKADIEKRANAIGIKPEFVNVTKRMDKSERLKNTTKAKKVPPSMDKNTRKHLGNIINNTGEKLMALYSNITWISIGNMPKGPNIGKPCIVLHCLDKMIVPFGEKHLPVSWEGYPVDIRESFVMLACSDGCRSLENGCSIGIPSVKVAGSVGIFVKRRFSELQVHGFLTAAHVALEKHRDLNNRNSFFSAHALNSKIHEITHPSIIDGRTITRIGRVKEAFYGQFTSKSNRIGIDAAFVETYEDTKESTEFHCATEDDLTFDGETVVTKTGRTTGTSFGVLCYDTCVFRTNDPEVRGKYYSFPNCYGIIDQDDNHPFFERGDSGSGVYLSQQNKKTNKVLGIGIGIASDTDGSDVTFVCNIIEIVRAFNIVIPTEKH